MTSGILGSDLLTSSVRLTLSTSARVNARQHQILDQRSSPREEIDVAISGAERLSAIDPTVTSDKGSRLNEVA